VLYNQHIMSPEQKQVVKLTPDQLETADYFLDNCGLRDFADVELEMMGQSGSVRYGLGRCAEYLMDRTPDEIRDMVMTKLEAQKHTT
jgi:hypothetical protein